MGLVIVVILFILIAAAVVWFVIWAFSKLNKYIASLEKQIDTQIARVDGFEDIIRDAGIQNKKIINKKLIPEDEEV